jgi:hypothetical protein
MRRSLRHGAVCGAVAALTLALAPPASALLGLGVSTPTVAMNLTPGSTASGSGTVVVTPPVVGTWHLSIADTTGHAGHLVPGAVGCTGAQAQTTNVLTATASGLVVGNSSAGPVTVGATDHEIAHGTLGDSVLVSLSLVVPNTERMPTGCVFSTTLTYTIQ